MVERARTHDSLPHNLITRKMAQAMFERTDKFYRRKTPVKAIQMEARFTIETRDGIVTGHPGDYVMDALDDGSPWVIPGDIFQTIFYEVTDSEKRQQVPNNQSKKKAVSSS